MVTQSLNWLAMANASAGYPASFIRNAGVSGNTTAQMAARVTADVVAYNPKVCLVLGGTNDAAAGTGSAVTIANLISIFDALVGAGIRPVACTVPPRTGISAPEERETISGTNTWLRDNFQSLYPTGKLCDWFSVLSEDGNVDNPVDAYFSDGIHFNAAGAAAAAAVLAVVLAALIGGL